MTEQTFFKNQFLIAMPQQGDPLFSEALIYLCEHDENGAMGLIVNKPLPINFSSLLQQLQIEISTSAFENLPEKTVFFGGPCQNNHGFILHNGGLRWPSSMPVTDELVLSSSKEILSDIALMKGPEKFLFALGYSGWGAGQLENEMAQNVWLNVNADSELIFSLDPEHRWHHAAMSIGIDINLVGGQAGYD